MATLLAITYSDTNRAKKAMESIDWSDFDHQINVKAACWVTNENGELKVHPRGQPVAGKAALGGALGLLIGGIFAIPVVGIAAGVAAGVRKGRHEDTGIATEFIKSVGDQLQNGGSAIVVLFEPEADTATAARDLAQYGGTVHSADLTAAQIDRYQALLDTQNHGAGEASGS